MNALLNVINAELFKVIRKRRVYILAFLWWVVLPVLILFVGRILLQNLSTEFVESSSPIAPSTIVETIASPFGIARISLMLPSVVSPSFYMMVLALLAALFIGDERSQNMWKTTLTAQPNRMAVLFGKFFAAMLIYGVLLFGGYLLSFVYGGIGMLPLPFLSLPTNFGGDWLGLFNLYLLQWLFGSAGMFFAFLMIWLLRNAVLGIIAILFAPPILEGIYSIYATLVGFQPVNRLNIVFQTLRLRKTLEDLPRYFFTNNLYAPARRPLSEVVTSLGGTPGSDDLGPLGAILGSGITLQSSALVIAGYALVFGLLMVWRFSREDVS
ncbi:MAG: hypothetical protein KC422_01360 [Trueperaceae bacterium]|nr:hypothetical protein [Trueperaceae bacterium]